MFNKRGPWRGRLSIGEKICHARSIPSDNHTKTKAAYVERAMADGTKAKAAAYLIIASSLSYFLYYTYHHIMGCGGSKEKVSRNDAKTEADRYARRKKNGFKDSGLERTRQDCVNQKKKLRHVEDPELARKKKVANIKQEQKKKPAGPLGLTDNELEKKRANLKHR
jgi:hypothetical protein